MKKAVLIVSILFILAFSVSMSYAAPRLTISEKTFNFGYVPQNSKISHTFLLQSTGDDTLKILKVVPG